MRGKQALRSGKLQTYKCYDKLNVNSRCNIIEIAAVVKTALWVRRQLPHADIRIFTNYTNQVRLLGGEREGFGRQQPKAPFPWSAPCAVLAVYVFVHYSRRPMQLLILREELDKVHGGATIPVQSITASQGAECDVAILSTVVAEADTSSGVRRWGALVGNVGWTALFHRTLRLAAFWLHLTFSSFSFVMPCLPTVWKQWVLRAIRIGSWSP